jgi:hypothetical protein
LLGGRRRPAAGRHARAGHDGARHILDVTACQLLIPRIASHNPGTVTVYYLLGGLGAYLPGLALSAGWADVVAVCLAASAVALLLAGLLATRLPARWPAIG